MLRKLVLTAALVLSVPAFANATWFVSASTSGSGTITSPDVVAGTGLNAIPDTTLTETFTVTPGAGNAITAVRLNGMALTATSPGVYTINKSRSSQYVTAYFAIVKATVNASVVGAGAIVPTTPTLTTGADYTVKIKPNTGNAITSVVVDGVDKGAITTWTWPAISGPHTIVANFAFAPSVTATVNATGTLVAGNAVTLSGVASTNDTGFASYSFLVNGSTTGVTQASPTATTATFTPTAPGTYVVTFTANTVNGGTGSVTSNVAILSTAVAAYNGCVNCHASRDTQVVNDFTASKHWNNLRNLGDSAVAGDQKATCSTNKCHFRATASNANACNTCHSDGLNADGTFKAAYTVGGFDGMNSYQATAAATCFSCHSGGKHGAPTDNFKKSSHYNGDHAKLYYQMDVKACVACHSAHLPESVTYDVCLNCHKPGTPYSIYSSNMVGKAPHFGGPIDQFNTQASFTGGGATCADCHGHNNTINAGWAAGGHGDVKGLPWVSDSGHTWDNQGPATNGVSFQNSPQQTNCVRCHTANGFAKFVDSGFVNIDKNYQADGVTVSKQSAPLTCNGCHLNPDNRAANGYTNQGLRIANFTTASHGTKGYKALWGYSTATIAKKKIVTSIQLADNRESNICMPCHAQRASGQEIKDLFAAPAFKQYSIGSNIYPHAAQPAAIFNGKGGYEFASAATYTDRARHQRIGNYVAGGATGYNNTGITQGSCVACHMSSAETHSLEITADSFTNTCYKCHPAEFTQANLDGKKADFDAAVVALGNLLVKKGITLDGINPLPERKAKDMSLGTKDNVVAEKNTGAWFNWYLFSTADKGAYAHNPSYARRLIFDSIDWMDDGIMNNSSAGTILSMATPGGALYNASVDTSKAVSFTNEPGCLGCHFGTGNVANGTAIPGVQQAPHMNTGTVTTATGTVTQAQYLSTNEQCNYCHGIGHGTDSPGGTILADYNESAHGDTAGEAWTHYDFKQSDRAACQQCHTTTGFVKYVTNGFVMATAATSWGTTGDTTKEVLACNACHSSTSWKTSVRNIDTYTVPAAYAPYAATYTAGMSNLCIVCHSGQASKANVDAKYAANENNTNVGLVNSHYLAAATTLYKTSGYTFYADPAKYANPSYYKHDKLGMNNYSAVSYATGVRKYDYSQNTGVNGPCVACHMNGTVGGLNGKSHTLDAVNVSLSMPASNGAVVTPAGQGCYGCHGTEVMADLIDGQKAGFQAALGLLTQVFKNNGVDYDPAFYPYFFATGSDHTNRLNGITNWTFLNSTVTNASAKLTHGAAFNLNLLTREPGAFAHNRYYSKRLIYDSLDYIQNGVNASGDVNGTVNFSNFSSATTPVSAARAYLGTVRP